MKPPLTIALAGVLLGGCTGGRASPVVRAPLEPAVVGVAATEPLVIGETFTIDSRALGEVRRINVFVPTVYGAAIDAPLSVLYVPDGGMAEDFLHVAGLVQVSVSNGTMRPFMVVGIENTQRRRDMTGPTTNAEDRAIAPIVGGSGAFRSFIADELMPIVSERYRTTDETAIMGESLAGLFVIETFFLAPALFDAYIALDPSLWWADHALVSSAAERLAARPPQGMSVFLASSSAPELALPTSRLAEVFAAHAPLGFSAHYEHFPGESHATLYHPGALRALRVLLGPAALPAR